MFASLPQRSVLRIAGRVRSVSADAMIDSRSGMTDHLARIQVDDDQLAQAAPGVELTPGDAGHRRPWVVEQHDAGVLSTRMTNSARAASDQTRLPRTIVVPDKAALTQ
jgi:hypothetical protein